jgi:transposase
VINQIRGLLLERGITFRKGRRHAEACLPGILEDADNGLSGLLRMLLMQLQDELRQLQSQIDEADARIAKAAREQEPCQRLMAIPGIGPLTATAVVASIGNGAEFRKGRSFAAWLGLVPKQESTGGKQKLLSVSKRGNHYLRRLSVSGARAVLTSNHSASVRGWASSHRECTATLRQSHWLTSWLASPGRCWPKARPIGLRCRSSRRRRWPAIDAWQRPGLEIAAAIPTIAHQRRRALTRFSARSAGEQ